MAEVMSSAPAAWPVAFEVAFACEGLEDRRVAVGRLSFQGFSFSHDHNTNHDFGGSCTNSSPVEFRPDAVTKVGYQPLSQVPPGTQAVWPSYLSAGRSCPFLICCVFRDHSPGASVLP